MRYNEPIIKYEILGVYNEKIEVIDSTDTYTDAVYLAAEYALAYGPEWQIYFHET